MKRTAVKKRPLLRAALILTGLALICDTLFVLTRSSATLGCVMPAIIGAPLLLCGLFRPLIVRASAKSGFAKLIVKLMITVYVLFFLLFSLTTALILVNSHEPEEPADVLIVLGCGIRGSSPTLTLRYRLDRAAEYLYENPDAVVIVSGGQNEDEICSEASVMSAYLKARGIDSSRIILEDKSESTEENFRFSKRIIDEMPGGEKRTVFVTTRFHVYRSELVAAKQGLDAQGLPAKGVWYITFNDYLRECAALTKYFLSGAI